jgi:hypothetical protein
MKIAPSFFGSGPIGKRSYTVQPSTPTPFFDQYEAAIVSTFVRWNEAWQMDYQVVRFQEIDQSREVPQEVRIIDVGAALMLLRRNKSRDVESLATGMQVTGGHGPS